MPSTTIIMPVSRSTYLDKLFYSLEILQCDAANTNLLVIVDGDAKLFIEVRNKVEMSKFAQRLCIQFKSKHVLRKYDVLGRRMRIADIHNEIKMHLWESDYIFGIEDDTIVPSNSLKKLLADYALYPYAGFIEGVEVGRWGIPYVGAWNTDNVYEPTEMVSVTVEKKDDKVEQIDAGGMYCFLTKHATYTNHLFKPFDNNGLGPDVDFGIELRREGLLNYIDWSVLCIHKTGDKDITLTNSEPRVVTFKKKEGRWRQHNSGNFRI